MSMPYLWPIALTGLIVTGCTSGGLEYWLYPEPRLPVEEEAVFATYESNRLLFLDGEDTATTCWGDRRMATQAYHRTDILCRLHIRPGKHSAVFQTGVNNTQRVNLDFTASPGKVYGLRRSGCTTSSVGVQQNCRFTVAPVEGRTGGK